MCFSYHEESGMWVLLERPAGSTPDLFQLLKKSGDVDDGSEVTTGLRNYPIS